MIGGNVFIFFGAALSLGSPTALFITAIHIPLVDLFIRREERQLETQFGDAWVRYRIGCEDGSEQDDDDRRSDVQASLDEVVDPLPHRLGAVLDQQQAGGDQVSQHRPGSLGMLVSYRSPCSPQRSLTLLH